MASEKTVTLYSCPTGGWVMGNRFALEDGIKKECGEECVVKHKVGCFLTATVAIDGYGSKSEFLPLAMIAPFNACTKVIKATSTGKKAQALLLASAGKPLAVDETPSTTAAAGA